MIAADWALVGIWVVGLTGLCLYLRNIGKANKRRAELKQQRLARKAKGPELWGRGHYGPR